MDLTFTTAEFLAVVDRHLDEMLATARELGDDLANRPPGPADANSAYALITHVVGMAHWWVGAMIGGRHIERDRPAEFRAKGRVAALDRHVGDLKRALRADLNSYDAGAPIRQPELLPLGSPARHWTHGAALLHMLEELAQHHGHLDLTRDLLSDRR